MQRKRKRIARVSEALATCCLEEDVYTPSVRSSDGARWMRALLTRAYEYRHALQSHNPLSRKPIAVSEGAWIAVLPACGSLQGKLSSSTRTAVRALSGTKVGFHLARRGNEAALEIIAWNRMRPQ